MKKIISHTSSGLHSGRVIGWVVGDIWIQLDDALLLHKLQIRACPSIGMCFIFTLDTSWVSVGHKTWFKRLSLEYYLIWLNLCLSLSRLTKSNGSSKAQLTQRFVLVVGGWCSVVNLAKIIQNLYYRSSLF